ncbi:MAG: hypothetical protein IJ232_09725, partial [Lachnospiraceae bacterium]|nr:hypothetical protein [Lachnospiraceae bacterium]
DSDRGLTLLVGSPKFVHVKTKLIVELNKEISPTPCGPNNIATSLFRMMPIRTVSPCKPPNTPVYFRMVWSFAICLFFSIKIKTKKDRFYYKKSVIPFA